MITSFEAGAIFRIKDEVSPVLKRLSERMEAFDSLAKRTLGSMERLGNIKLPGLIGELGDVSKALGGITRESTAVRDAMLANFSKIDGAIGTTLAEVERLKTEMVSLSRLPSGGAPSLRYGAGGRGGGGGAGGPHLRASTMPVPGGHLSAGGGAAMWPWIAAGFTAFEAGKIAGDFQESMSRISSINPQFRKQVDQTPGGLTQAPFYKQMLDIEQSFAVKTGSSDFKANDEAMVTIVRMLGARGADGKVADMSEILSAAPSILNAARMEARDKGTNLQQGVESIVGIMHQAQVFDPAGSAELARLFSYVAITDPEKLTRIKTSSSYVMPIAKQLGADVAETLLGVDILQQSGITGKSGTWERQFLTGGLATGKKKHDTLLEDAGLIDASGKPLWRDPTTGELSLIREAEIVQKYLETFPEEKRFAASKEIFGQQGAYGSAMFANPTAISALKQMSAQSKEFTVDPKAWERAMGESPILKFHQEMAKLEVILQDLGFKILPVVVTGLALINTGMEKLGNVLGAAGGATSHILGTMDKSSGKVNGKSTGLPEPLLEHMRKFLPPNPADLPAGSPQSGGIAGRGYNLGGGVWVDGSGASIDPIYAGVYKALVDWSAFGGGVGGGGYEMGGGGSGGGFGGAHASLRHGHRSLGGSLNIGGGVARFDGDTSARAKRLMSILIGKGWTKEGAATAAAEAFGESAIRAGAAAGDGGRSHNMFQWDARRFSQFHGDPKNFDAIANFFDWERKNHGQGGWSSAKSLEEGIRYGQQFELYADKSGATERYRGALARGFMKLLQGDAGGGSGVGWDSLSPAQKERYKKDRFIGIHPDAHQREHEVFEIHLHNYMDGKKVAEVVTHYQTRHAMFPRQAPYHNSRAYASAPDIGFATG